MARNPNPQLHEHNIFQPEMRRFQYRKHGKLRKDYNFGGQRRTDEIAPVLFFFCTSILNPAVTKALRRGRRCAAARFGAGSDFGFEMPFRFFCLPTPGSESRR